MPKPVCVKCQRFYRPKKNGIFWLEQMPKENRALPGTQEPEKWQPYKVWSADLWECQGCQHQIVAGHGLDPVSEHFHLAFDDWKDQTTITVNDC